MFPFPVALPGLPPKYAPWETQGELFWSGQLHAQAQGWQPAAGLGGTAILLRVVVMNALPLLPLTVTLVGPNGWPYGIWTVNWVEVAVRTGARLGPNLTVACAGFAGKPDPWIVTTSPAWPVNGVMPVIDCAAAKVIRQKTSPAARTRNVAPIIPPRNSERFRCLEYTLSPR